MVRIFVLFLRHTEELYEACHDFVELKAMPDTTEATRRYQLDQAQKRLLLVLKWYRYLVRKSH